MKVIFQIGAQSKPSLQYILSEIHILNVFLMFLLFFEEKKR